MEVPSSPLAGSSLQPTALLSKRWTNYASFSFYLLLSLQLYRFLCMQKVLKAKKAALDGMRKLMCCF